MNHLAKPVWKFQFFGINLTHIYTLKLLRSWTFSNIYQRVDIIFCILVFPCISIEAN